MDSITSNDQQIDTAAKIIWDYMHMYQKLEKADAIFVLGSRDLRVPAYAAELYNEGWAPLVIFSGHSGKGKSKELWGMTEAEKFTEVAIKLGVPAKAILLENEATNTGDNILFTKRLLEEENLHPTKLILVQKPYMERRTYATFVKQWPGMDFSVTSPRISFEKYPNDENSKDYFINVMVGDLQRIKEYPAKGFQIEQEVPGEVWAAYEELVQEGYTEHLIKE